MKTGSIFGSARNGRLALLAVLIAAATALTLALVLRDTGGDGTASADVSAAPPSAPSAAGYIKYDGIDGEATDVGHENWSEIVSFSQSVSVPISSFVGSVRSRGLPQVRDFVVTKRVDKATPKLMEAIVKGTRIPLVQMEIASPDADGSQRTYLKYELRNVLISNYRVGGSASGDSVPVESISLNYEEIKVTYSEGSKPGAISGGNVEFEWKVEEGES
jgi:type VI secretion system secreted protein Hcp